MAKVDDNKWLPLADKYIVRLDEAPSETPGGILIPDSAKEKQRTGVVVQAGDGTLDKHGNYLPPRVVKGAAVLIGQYAGTPVQGDVTLLIVGEPDILAVAARSNAAGAYEPLTPEQRTSVLKHRGL